MVPLTICPRCYGQIQDSSGKSCHVCFGYGVVYPLIQNCTRCGGEGCGQCAKGFVAVAMPFVHRPTTRYTREEIEQAQIWLRSGFPPDVEEDGYYRPLGLVGGLLLISQEYDGDSGEWLQNILHDADAVVIDPSGIYLQHGDEGIRIYQFTHS